MKIIDNTSKGVSFVALAIATTFKYGDSYFLKTQEVTNEYGKIYNAVGLNTGTHYCFSSNDKVFPFNCELIVL